MTRTDLCGGTATLKFERLSVDLDRSRQWYGLDDHLLGETALLCTADNVPDYFRIVIRFNLKMRFHFLAAAIDRTLDH